MVVHAESTEVDAIILVDTSATMSDELDHLCADLPGTLDAIRASGLNVRARVVSITERSRCTDSTVRLLIKNSTVTDDEDWGPAVFELIGGYTWQPSVIRLIVVVSDAGPDSGNPVADPGADRDAITRVIQAATKDKVILSAVLGGPASDDLPADRARLETLARDMAAATGGRMIVSRTPDDVPTAVRQLIVAAVESTAGLTAIAAAIPTPGKISLDPGVVLTNIVLAGVVVMLFGLTALLFDEAFGKIRARGLPSNRVTHTIGRAAQRASQVFSIGVTPSAWPSGNVTVRRLATAVVLTALLALIALIGSFLDPDYTASTPRGIATSVSILAAFALVTFATVIGGKQAARSMQATSSMRVRPGAILVVALWVLVSRSLGFLPGYLIGLPAGLAIVSVDLTAEQTLPVGRASILAAIGIGLLAWLAALPVDALLANLSGSLNSSAVSVALLVIGAIQSALLTTFLIAVQFALVNMLPLGTRTGSVWLARQRLLWAGVFAVVVFGALHTIFNPNRIGLDALRNPGLLPLGAILTIYSGVTLVAWLLTNESRIRERHGLNRRSAIIAGALIVVWLGGFACVGLTALTSAIKPEIVLILMGIAVVVGVAAWIITRARAGRASPPQA
jgi:hypothetical protein